MKKNVDLFDQWIHIGGLTTVGKSIDQWYWVNSGNQVNFPLSFNPGQPDNAFGKEFCLTLGVFSNNESYFNDIRCNERELKFICQQDLITFQN